jgi:chromosomal replication initiator protein
MDGMNQRLISRFSSGLTVKLDPPDYETRVAILKAKIPKTISINESVIECIAKHNCKNIRELEGAMLSIIAKMTLLRGHQRQKPITKTYDNESFSQNKCVKLNVSIEDIGNVVAKYFGIQLNDIKKQGRQKNIVMARHITMYFANQYTQYSLQVIGDALLRDYSSVIYAIRSVQYSYDNNELQYRMIIDDIRSRIENIKTK